jgi:hypothetical protein
MGSTMILLIDNYDSFTWNLVHRLGELGAEVTVERNDALSVAQALARLVRVDDDTEGVPYTGLVHVVYEQPREGVTSAI